MSHPTDLDEYTEDELRGELRRRRILQAERKCDYCERPNDTPACRFPERHSRML